MYNNVRSSRVQAQNLVPLEAVQEIVQQMQNPIKKEKLIEADGGAYRSYFYQISNKIPKHINNK